MMRNDSGRVYMFWRWVKEWFTKDQAGLPAPNRAEIVRAKEPEHGQIEDFPAGYPRFAALIGSDPSLQVYRRFATLRSRLMLRKQDSLSLLEQRLEKIDRDEPRVLFLGNMRRDRNRERTQVLNDIDVALAEYDTLAERNDRAFARSQGPPRDVQSLQNWLGDSPCITRCESGYLYKQHDLMTLATSNTDCALDIVARPLEWLLTRFPTRLTKGLRIPTTRDPRLWIFSKPFVQASARFILACLLITLLLVPVILMNTTKSLKMRLFFIWLSSTLFILSLAGMTKARTPEVFVAGTTYAAILVVFIADRGINSS